MAGLGLVRVWRDVFERRAKAMLPLGFPLLGVAVAIHGLYNAFSVYLALIDFRF